MKVVKNIRKKKKIKKIVSDNKRAVYFKFLKALSSSLELIILDFKRDEMNQLSNMDINITPYIQDIHNEYYRNNDTESDPNANRIVILMKTRLARNIPSYDYEELIRKDIEL